MRHLVVVRLVVCVVVIPLYSSLYPVMVTHTPCTSFYAVIDWLRSWHMQTFDWLGLLVRERSVSCWYPSSFVSLYSTVAALNPLLTLASISFLLGCGSNVCTPGYLLSPHLSLHWNIWLVQVFIVQSASRHWLGLVSGAGICVLPGRCCLVQLCLSLYYYSGEELQSAGYSGWFSLSNASEMVEDCGRLAFASTVL